MKKKKSKHFKEPVADEKDKINQGMYYKQYLEWTYGRTRAKAIRHAQTVKMMKV